MVDAFARVLDTTRPISAAIAQPVGTDRVGRYLDIVHLMSFGRPKNDEADDDDDDNTDDDTDTGDRLRKEAANYNYYYNNSAPDRNSSHPLLTLEYPVTGSGRPASVWSPQENQHQQTEQLARTFRSLDRLRRESQMGGGPYVIGEFVDNFADYRTEEDEQVLGGWQRGIFTRQRQPKAVAQLLRQRYRLIAQVDAKFVKASWPRPVDRGAKPTVLLPVCALPADLFPYAMAGLEMQETDPRWPYDEFEFVPCDEDW